jgi:catechol 2,3-dioxygenase-like lactoylglutathione lyase family enzyme
LSKTSILGVTPVLGVSDSRAAEEFYCGKLGFELQFAYRPFGDRDDPCHMGVKRDNTAMRVSSFSGHGVPGTGVIIWTDDVDLLHEEFVSKAVPIEMGPTDQVWGLREIHVRDPDDNKLTFAQALQTE